MHCPHPQPRGLGGSLPFAAALFRASWLSIYLYICLYIYVSMYVSIYLHLSLSLCTHVSLYTYIYIYICIYIYISHGTVESNSYAVAFALDLGVDHCIIPPLFSSLPWPSPTQRQTLLLLSGSTPIQLRWMAGKPHRQGHICRAFPRQRQRSCNPSLYLHYLLIYSELISHIFRLTVSCCSFILCQFYVIWNKYAARFQRPRKVRTIRFIWEGPQSQTNNDNIITILYYTIQYSIVYYTIIETKSIKTTLYHN